MSLRPSELAQVAEELRSLVGAVVQKAYAPRPKLAYLDLRVPGQTVSLCLSAEPEVSRLSVASGRPPSPREPLPFQRWLRQELLGARLESIEPRPGDRVVFLGFRQEGKPRGLWAELTGPHGNLVLTREEERILALSARASGPRASLQPGATYQPPSTSEPRQLPSRLLPLAGAPFPFLQAAEALVGEKGAERWAEEARRRLLSPLKARLSRAERTLLKVRADGERTGEAEEHRRTGELLSQNLHLLLRGQSSVSLTEYTEAGPVAREVKLDPRLSPKEQVERHFHQYRRLLRGAEHARRRLAELESELNRLREAIAEVQASPREELLHHQELLPPPREKTGPPRAQPYKEYLSASGQRIWVGKGAESNEALTFRIARPHHLWLHARGFPGSHVVVPLEKNASLSQELLLDAAHLALHHSGAKGESLAEVAYTQVKHVKKPRGAAPGQVIFSREKTLRLRLEPERLQRLLRARE